MQRTVRADSAPTFAIWAGDARLETLEWCNDIEECDLLGWTSQCVPAAWTWSTIDHTALRKNRQDFGNDGLREFSSLGYVC